MLDVNQSQGCLLVCNLGIGEEICADENTGEEEGLCIVHAWHFHNQRHPLRQYFFDL